jgi:hypothetical protein
MQKKNLNITSKKFLSIPEYTKNYMLLANDWLQTFFSPTYITGEIFS